MLTEKKGLPPSRLLTLKEADARYSKREELKRTQEESASPILLKDERQCQGGGEGGKGDFGGHEEGGGEVLQHGSFDWRFA